MRFHTRKWVKPEDLNANGTLFGGKVLSWIDEEAVLYTIIQLENKKIVTKYMSEINFMSTAVEGDIIEIGIDVIKFGVTSIAGADFSEVVQQAVTVAPIDPDLSRRSNRQ